MNEVIKQFNKDFKDSFVDNRKPIKKTYRIYWVKNSDTFTHVITESINGRIEYYKPWYYFLKNGSILID